jgi:nucleoside-diphosphate-sugar epimerase
MNLVVTGAEGFLGRRLVAALAAAGREVVAIDRIPHAGGRLPGVTYVQTDLEDVSRLLPESVQPGAPFVLLHLAWDMRRFQGYGLQVEQIRPFAQLLDHWSERGLRGAVVMGTAEEFGGRDGVISEEDPPRMPLSPYGWAKRAARELAQSWSMKSGLPVTWLRPFIIYGPGQKGDMLIPFAVECARRGQRAQFTDGLQKRDFVYIDDVVAAIVLAAEQRHDGFEAFNLGRGEPVLVADVLRGIARHFQAEALFDLGGRPRRPGEPDVQVADITKARARLGWTSTVNWTEGLRRVCEGDVL